MSIRIVTYSNPYCIERESFWDDIKNCAQFCVSQTMVNGLYGTYRIWKENGQLATIQSLTNAMFQNWDDITVKVRQIMEVDNAINTLPIEHDNVEKIKKSLLYNTKPIADSIRIFAELGMDPESMNREHVNLDQQYLIDIYRQISQNEQTSFTFTHLDDSDTIQKALVTALRDNNKDVQEQLIDFNTIVIHGVHQFTPTMLCAIEDLSKYKTVILMFNYQTQYQAVYETWLNIYSLFGAPIKISVDNQYTPSALDVYSYSSNALADSIGKITNGECANPCTDIEVIEFANLTEFANYAAGIFEKASKKSEESGATIPPVAFMSEQMYAASNKVNDILRAYFPAQFGERHFLDYPIGHFFVATTNMWDSDNNRVIVENLSDLKECLSAGIIMERKPGALISTLNRIAEYIEKENTLNGIITRLTNLQKYVGGTDAERNRIGYFCVEQVELKDLILALKDLNQIIIEFFSDFSQGSDNFRRFYKRIQQFITNKVSNMSELDDEMKTVIQRLLERMSKSDLPDTGTFTCLKQTMSFYLSQDDHMNKGAKWIVRGFEQIDGDILRSASQDPAKTCYHFCCLSDNNICGNIRDVLPWPLDVSFFDRAQAPVEWKYRIFLQSKMEYSQFKRYALLYGLEFNRLGCKLSYIRSEDDKDNELYFILQLLGLKVKKYQPYHDSSYSPKLSFGSDDSEQSSRPYTTVERYKAAICPYRFAQEVCIQGKTEFRDPFLIHTYLRVLIGNEVQKQLQGLPYDESRLRAIITTVYQKYSDKMKLVDELEKTKLIAAVYGDVSRYAKKSKRFARLRPEDIDFMRLHEELLFISVKDMAPCSQADTEKIAKSDSFIARRQYSCLYCASKDICMEYRSDQEK